MNNAVDSQSGGSLPRRLRMENQAEPLRDKQPARPERAVLVGILLPDTKADLQDPLGELAALAESAGAEIVDQLIQKRTRLASGTALGKGKVQELSERVEANDADTVIFDMDLTPRQIRSLEKEINRKIIDRSELILDIFASRARTREARLQVELAQLEYTAPRLRGMWTHLERIAGAGGGTSAGAVGGVGTRGPGERQIEIDRRIVKDRIAVLKRELADIDDRRQREVKSRKDEYTVSLVGYTNSGKTSLFNALTSNARFAADKLFATLDTKTARWEIGEGEHVLLSDTVGFVRDLPHHLVASFRATLEETIHAHLLLHVVDASSPTALAQVEAVNEVLSSLGVEHRNSIVLLNKMDVANDLASAHMVELRERRTMRISALVGTGLEELRAEVSNLKKGEAVEVTVLVPHAEGKLATELGKNADILERDYTDTGVRLRMKINRTQFNQLCRRYDCLEILEGEDALDPLEEDEPWMT